MKKIFPRPISKSIQSVFSSRNLWFQVLHLSLFMGILRTNPCDVC